MTLPTSLRARPFRSSFLRTLVAASAAALALAGCGSSGDAGSSTSPSPSQSTASGNADTTQQIDVSVKGDTITPTNKRIPVTRGKPVTMVITSDRSGELHVHSSPEQHIEFDQGTTKKTLTFDTAGIIEVEEHKSDTLIAQLEVR